MVQFGEHDFLIRVSFSDTTLYFFVNIDEYTV